VIPPHDTPFLSKLNKFHDSCFWLKRRAATTPQLHESKEEEWQNTSLATPTSFIRLTEAILLATIHITARGYRCNETITTPVIYSIKLLTTLIIGKHPLIDKSSYYRIALIKYMHRHAFYSFHIAMLERAG